MATPAIPPFELCSAEYVVTLVPVPGGPAKISILAHGVHPTSGYEVIFHKSPQEVYPPEFSLWHLKPAGTSLDVITPFAKFMSFEAHGKVNKVRITDATGSHDVPVTGVNQKSVLASLKTLVGPRVKVDGAKSQPCYADSCANRGELSVTLPVGATYVATHYFTTADYPNDRADVYETGPKEVSYARFSDAVHSPNNNNQEVVTVYYYNRANRTRWVAINVDYE